MRFFIALLGVTILVGAAPVEGQVDLEPVKTVEIGKCAELRVNGKPFFPLMLWLQVPRDFARQKQLGFNVMAGYAGEEGKLDAYAATVWKAGMYFIPSLPKQIGPDARKIAGSLGVLGWIQGDEPDMPKVVSDAEVTPGPMLRVNPRTPFYRIVDGDVGSWTAIEPVVGSQFTIKPKAPVTVYSLAIWQTISAGLCAAKDVVFLADGKEILKATLENKRGAQKFELQQPAAFSELTVKILSEYEGKSGFGSLGEVEAFDKEGRNVLLSKPRTVPRSTPEELLQAYQAAKQLDPQRPVLMTFTAMFMKESKGKYDLAVKDALYPAMVKHCDVVGFDVYPIYGSGMPGRLHEVAEGVTQLRAIAGAGKPVYAWIETNKGSRWMTFSKQLDVKPEHTRCEVWMAVIRGARGIAYFTHRWQPDYKQFAPTDEMQQELKRLNAQLTRLAPAILAPAAKVKVGMTLDGGLKCHLMATQHEGALYVFAQNLDLGPGAEKLKQFQPISPRSGKAIFSVAGLAPGAKVEVLDEQRTLTAEEGRFADEFPPLGEHVYRIPAGALRNGGTQ